MTSQDKTNFHINPKTLHVNRGETVCTLPPWRSRYRMILDPFSTSDSRLREEAQERKTWQSGTKTRRGHNACVWYGCKLTSVHIISCTVVEGNNTEPHFDLFRLQSQATLQQLHCPALVPQYMFDMMRLTESICSFNACHTFFALLTI